jgi:hypothetical protein
MVMKAENIHLGPTQESMNSPDTFRARRVWRSPIFKMGLIGGVVGAVVFGIVGYLIVRGFLAVPYGSALGTQGTLSAVLTFAGGGLLLTALVTSLIALLNRG